MFKELFTEGTKFHPTDVFSERYVITNGKDIIGVDGEVRTISQFKKDMQQKSKSNWDHIYFPTEKMAKDAYKEMKMSKPYEVKKLSYHKDA